jgi:hypothetical protein
VAATLTNKEVDDASQSLKIFRRSVGGPPDSQFRRDFRWDAGGIGGLAVRDVVAAAVMRAATLQRVRWRTGGEPDRTAASRHDAVPGSNACFDPRRPHFDDVRVPCTTLVCESLPCAEKAMSRGAID